MSLPLRFVPEPDAGAQPNVVVDGSPNRGTVLTISHWPGIPDTAGVAADTSAQMVFRYLDAGAADHGTADVVTNNHFDQDGLVGVFALTSPAVALEQRSFLEDVAAAGDFATYRTRDAARVSMVIAAFADPARSPLDGTAFDGDYPEQCGALYRELLDRLPHLQRELGLIEHLWADEDAALTASEAAIRSGRVVVDERRDLDLAVVHVPEDAWYPGGHRFAHVTASGVHPMALHNATSCFRLVQIRGRRYELTYRYESWVQYRSRRPLPRVDLAPLAERLNQVDGGDGAWRFDGVSQLTPGLRMADGADSRLSPERFVSEVTRYLQEAPAAWDPYQASR